MCRMCGGTWSQDRLWKFQLGEMVLMEIEHANVDHAVHSQSFKRDLSREILKHTSRILPVVFVVLWLLYE